MFGSLDDIADETFSTRSQFFPLEVDPVMKRGKMIIEGLLPLKQDPFAVILILKGRGLITVACQDICSIILKAFEMY